MMYGYTTLPDNTGIAHSEIMPDGSVQVCFEKPVEGGVHYATCKLPDRSWEEKVGFSDEEIRSLEEFLRDNSEAIFASARQLQPGVFFSAVPEKKPDPPQPKTPEAPAPQRQPVQQSPSYCEPSAPDTPPVQPKKSSGGGKGKKFLLSLLTIAVFYGIGTLAGQLMSGPASGGTTVTSVPAVKQTVAPTTIPVLTMSPTSTPIPTVVITAPDVSDLLKVNHGDAHWDYLKATDSEIRSAMEFFWCGDDARSGGKCAFFISKDEKRGGYMWLKRTDAGGVLSEFALGDLVENSNTSIIVYDKDGEKTYISLVLHDKDKSMDMSVSPCDSIKGSVHLKYNSDYKEEMLRIILAYVHALQRMKGE